MHRNKKNNASLFSWVKMASGVDHGHVHPGYEDDVQHGGHTPANRSIKACNHTGLQHTYLILNIHVMVNNIINTCKNKTSTDQYHVTILQAQV